jgi:hypothetical protein
MPSPVSAGDPSADGQDVVPVTIEFLMASGETFTAQEFVNSEDFKTGVERLGEVLVREIAQGVVHRFPYWEEESYYFDAVRMDQVAAFTISPTSMDDDEE